MQIRSILLVLVVVQVGLVTFGGYIYSLIEIEADPARPNCSSSSSTSSETNENQSYEIVSDQTESSENLNDLNKTVSSMRPSFSDSVFFVVTTVTTIG